MVSASSSSLPAPQATPEPTVSTSPPSLLVPQVNPVDPVTSLGPDSMHNPLEQSTMPLQKSSWKSVLTNSQDSPRVRPPGIEVLNGTAHVTVPAEVLADPTPLWNSFIVGHFLGEEAPHIGKVHATVNRLWQNQDRNMKIDAQFITSKTVLFRIENAHIRSRVLRRHCWHISDTPMVVQQWSPSSAKEKPDLSSIPIWVDFKNVPDNLFSRKGLLFLGDIIGFAQKLHPNTERCTRLDVARVLVEVNLNTDLPSSICLKSEPEIKIAVSYPWLPFRCSLCKGWGHAGKECEAATTGLKLSEKSASTNGAVASHKEPNSTPSRPGKEMAEPSGKNLGSLEVVTQISSPINKVIDTKKSEEVRAIDTEKTEEVGAIDRGKNKEVSTGEGLHSMQEHEHSEPWTIVTRGKKSPGTTRMLRGKRVDSGDTNTPSVTEEDEPPFSPQRAQTPNMGGPEKDRMEEGEITANLLPGSSSDDEVESTKQQLTKQEERNQNNKKQKKSTTSTNKNNKGTRHTSTRKSSSRKA